MKKTSLADRPGTIASVSEPRFFGQPRGLAYLAFTEMWERFSYYGMIALLVLYMTDTVLRADHQDKVLGLSALRSLLEGVAGPLSTQAFGSQIFGFYSGFVYFTPILGGWVADRWLGARRTVILGILLMTAGHFAMAFERSFVIALALLVAGSGCLKGNISTLVGTLYDRADEAGRTRGFAVFSMAINIGAVAGPLLCGLLVQLYGWHVGFAAAGGSMIAALATYLSAGRHLSPSPPRSAPTTSTSGTTEEWRTVWILIAIIAITVFQTIVYHQIWNVGMIWIRDAVDLRTGLGSIPVPWFSSVDAFASIVAVPAIFALWRRQSDHGGEPRDLAKIGLGAVIAAGSAGLLAAADFLGGGRHVSVLWPLLAFFGMGVAFLYYWPTVLALVSRHAPARFNARMMGLVFCSLFVGDVAMGRIGGLYSEMQHWRFWLLNAVIAALGFVTVRVAGGRLEAALGRWSVEPAELAARRA